MTKKVSKKVSKKESNNRKKMLSVAAALALVAAISGTFAWITSKDDVTNKFEGARLTIQGIKIQEIFTKPTDWNVNDPKVVKEVTVANTSGEKALIRARFKESFRTLVDVSEKRLASISSVDEKYKAVSLDLSGYLDDEDWNTTGEYELTSELKTKYPDLKVIGKLVETKSDGTNVYEAVFYNDYTVSEQERITQKFDVVRETVTINEGANGKKVVSFNDTGDHAANTGYVFIDKTKHPESLVDWTAAPEALKAPVDGSTPGSISTSLARADNLNAQIRLDYGKLVDVANGVRSSWIYNQEDGYFYYVGSVPGGGFTSKLLNSVTLLDSADVRYSLFEYDLNIEAEGISTNKAAVEANWNLSSRSTGVSLEVYNKIKAYTTSN